MICCFACRWPLEHRPVALLVPVRALQESHSFRETSCVGVRVRGLLKHRLASLCAKQTCLVHGCCFNA